MLLTFSREVPFSDYLQEIILSYQKILTLKSISNILGAAFFLFHLQNRKGGEMKRLIVFVSFVGLLSLTLFAGGPGNKATGSLIRVRDVTNPGSQPWKLEFAAHEPVVMKKGKIRPAKGMALAYKVDDSSKFWAIDVKCVNVLDEENAVFAGEVVMTSDVGNVKEGDYLKLWVQDFGEPGAGTDFVYSVRKSKEDPDLMPDVVDFCENPENHFDSMGLWYVVDGNLQVHFRE
jgi:hypothetical protein